MVFSPSDSLCVHSVACDVSVLELKEDRSSRQDTLFIRKVGRRDVPLFPDR